MTDERMGDALWPALRHMPVGSGVILRHDRLPPEDRLRLGLKVAAIARTRGMTIGVAGDVLLARALRADLVHRPDRAAGLLPHSMPVHNDAEALAARRSGASLCFISPIFPTTSHPGAAALGRDEAIRLAKLAAGSAIALGGMSERQWRRLGGTFHGYAGIDCWIRT